LLDDLLWYLYQLLWNIENSDQLPQQLKHTRTKFYIYVILEYRVPWLEIYKYPLPDTCFPTCNMHKTFVRWSFMILYYFLFLMHVYLSTNLWNFYTNKTVYSSTVYHLVKISKETPIWYTYLVKGTCIFRANYDGQLDCLLVNSKLTSN
jgi:hypothetical protein